MPWSWAGWRTLRSAGTYSRDASARDTGTMSWLPSPGFTRFMTLSILEWEILSLASVASSRNYYCLPKALSGNIHERRTFILQ